MKKNKDGFVFVPFFSQKFTFLCFHIKKTRSTVPDEPCLSFSGTFFTAPFFFIYSLTYDLYLFFCNPEERFGKVLPLADVTISLFGSLCVRLAFAGAKAQISPSPDGRTRLRGTNKLKQSELCKLKKRFRQVLPP